MTVGGSRHGSGSWVYEMGPFTEMAKTGRETGLCFFGCILFSGWQRVETSVRGGCVKWRCSPANIMSLELWRESCAESCKVRSLYRCEVQAMETDVLTQGRELCKA